MAASIALWGLVVWCVSRAFGAWWPLVRAWVTTSAVQSEERRWRIWSERALEYEQRLKSGLALQIRVLDVGVDWQEQLVRLQERGGKLVPFLERTRTCSDSMADGWRDVRVKLAPAQAQAWALALFVPAAWVGLLVLIPELESRIWTWRAAGAAACVWAMLGFRFLSHAAQRAARGGTAKGSLIDVSSKLLWPETLLGEIACGLPPDLAWQTALRASGVVGEAAHFWTEGGLPAARTGGLERLSLAALEEARRVCWFSLLEGKPCFDRIENLGEELRKDHFAAVRREIEVLQTRALLPLFVFFAPALAGLLAAALFITWESFGGT